MRCNPRACLQCKTERILRTKQQGVLFSVSTNVSHALLGGVALCFRGVMLVHQPSDRQSNYSSSSGRIDHAGDRLAGENTDREVLQVSSKREVL